MKFVDDDDDDDDEATVMLFVPVQYERILYSLLTQRRDDVLTTSLVIAPICYLFLETTAADSFLDCVLPNQLSATFADIVSMFVFFDSH